MTSPVKPTTVKRYGFSCNYPGSVFIERPDGEWEPHEVAESLRTRLQEAQDELASRPTEWAYQQACRAIERHRIAELAAIEDSARAENAWKNAEAELRKNGIDGNGIVDALIFGFNMVYTSPAWGDDERSPEGWKQKEAALRKEFSATVKKAITLFMVFLEFAKERLRVKDDCLQVKVKEVAILRTALAAAEEELAWEMNARMDAGANYKHMSEHADLLEKNWKWLHDCMRDERDKANTSLAAAEERARVAEGRIEVWKQNKRESDASLKQTCVDKCEHPAEYICNYGDGTGYHCLHCECDRLWPLEDEVVPQLEREVQKWKNVANGNAGRADIYAEEAKELKQKFNKQSFNRIEVEAENARLTAEVEEWKKRAEDADKAIDSIVYKNAATRQYVKDRDTRRSLTNTEGE